MSNPEAACKGGNSVTVWNMVLDETLPIFYFQLEGNSMSDEDREKVCDYYRSEAERTPQFATLYDLTRGLPNMKSHLIPMASFCNSMRPTTEKRLQFTVVVCPDMIYRGILSVLLKLAPAPSPFFVVSNLDEAWEVLSSRGRGSIDWIPDNN
jgi:hypothetical protein